MWHTNTHKQNMIYDGWRTSKPIPVDGEIVKATAKYKYLEAKVTNAADCENEIKSRLAHGGFTNQNTTPDYLRPEYLEKSQNRLILKRIVVNILEYDNKQ